MGILERMKNEKIIEVLMEVGADKDIDAQDQYPDYRKEENTEISDLNGKWHSGLSRFTCHLYALASLERLSRIEWCCIMAV